MEHGNLVEDVLHIIVQYLTVQDILKFAQAFKLASRACAAKQTWMRVWYRDVLPQGAPLSYATSSLDTLDASQTKSLVLHALKLQQSMTCAAPSKYMRKFFLPQSQAITWTTTVAGKWLLVATSDTSISMLVMYSVAALFREDSHRPVAIAYLDGPVRKGLTQVSETGEVTIALELQASDLNPVVEVLTINTLEGSPVFVRLARRASTSHLLALDGTLVGFALDDDLSVPCILNWKTGSVLHLWDRPEPQGGIIAMAIDGENVALLTPSKLSVMHVPYGATNALQCSHIAQLSAPKRIGFGTVAFSPAAPGADTKPKSLLTCISTMHNMCVYSIPLGAATLFPDVQSYCIRTYALSRVPGEAMRYCTAQPLISSSRTNLSWLEGLYGCPDPSKITSMRFVTFKEGLSITDTPTPSETVDLSPSTNQHPVFALSELDMPALYAMSSRYYDDEFGLLAVGNVMGELALYSIGGTAFLSTQEFLQPVVFPTHEDDGKELLPTTPICASPFRIPLMLAGSLSDMQIETYRRFCEAQWPEGETIPPGWSREALFDEDGEWLWEDFLYRSGELAWQLEHAGHVLGPPVPLLVHVGPIPSTNYTLLKVGKLFVVHNPSGDPRAVFHVLDPAFELRDALAWLRVSQPTLEHRLQYHTAWTVEIDESVVADGKRFWPMYLWERRTQGVDRWKAFVERGGKVEFESPFPYIEHPSLDLFAIS